MTKIDLKFSQTEGFPKTGAAKVITNWNFDLIL